MLFLNTSNSTVVRNFAQANNTENMKSHNQWHFVWGNSIADWIFVLPEHHNQLHFTQRIEYIYMNWFIRNDLRQ